jgi:hypothetical protein
MLIDVHVRVEGSQALARYDDLVAADVPGRVEDLPLKIALVDPVVIDETEPAHARRGEIQARGAAEPAQANKQNGAAAQAELTLHANLGQGEVAPVSLELIRGEGFRRLTGGIVRGRWHQAQLAEVFRRGLRMQPDGADRK